MKRTVHLTPGEFELIEILWPLGEASVKAVWEKVDPARGLAYTTVMTVLEKMFRKGILTQRKKGKAYLYSPALTREQAISGILEHISNAYFHGSRQELIAFVQKHYAAMAAEAAAESRPEESSS
jgi:BlaI family transcriptional regulator, penicillinase repressor